MSDQLKPFKGGIMAKRNAFKIGGRIIDNAAIAIRVLVLFKEITKAVCSYLVVRERERTKRK